METLPLAMTLLIWLQIKHFVADYLLQPPWMLRGKGSFFRVGGYVHAGIHAVGTLPVLLATNVELRLCLILFCGEFVIHYLIDYVKATLSSGSAAKASARTFWAMHGADQLMHQLTYAAIIWLVLTDK